MLLHNLVVLCFAIGIKAQSYLGGTAKAISARGFTDETAYDFVIAGGGIAGLTVADRLTENPNGR